MPTILISEEGIALYENGKKLMELEPDNPKKKAPRRFALGKIWNILAARVNQFTHHGEPQSAGLDPRLALFTPSETVALRTALEAWDPETTVPTPSEPEHAEPGLYPVYNPTGKPVGEATEVSDED